MGYKITLNASDMIKASHAALSCAFLTYPEARVKPRDPEKILEGWMAQQAVGKYHYMDPTYDVRQWIHTGRGDTEDGYEIRCNALRTLWISAADKPDQKYWLIMPIKDNAFWLLGSIHREDVQHLEVESERTPGRYFIKYAELIPFIRDVHRPLNYGRKMA
jgi:hypothetical protein